MTAEHAAAVGGEEFDPYASRTVAEIVHDYAVVRGDLVEQYARDQLVNIVESRLAATRQAAADTVLAAARRLCCGDNPAPHHAATHDHSQRMAFAEELARAVRGS